MLMKNVAKAPIADKAAIHLAKTHEPKEAPAKKKASKKKSASK